MKSVGEEELERWFDLSHTSYNNEAQFFALLLASTVYVHLPISDDSRNLRLIQFRHPDGFDAIPLFTSALRSERATFSAVRHLRLPCMELFKSTRGATLMVNPNDGGPVLYPEEITTLLESGTLKCFEKIELARTSDVRPAENPPACVVAALQTSIASTPFIRHVYLLDRRASADESIGDSLLIYLGVDAPHRERAARHVVSIVQQLEDKPDRIVDIAVYDAAESRPTFLDEIGATPVFSQVD